MGHPTGRPQEARRELTSKRQGQTMTTTETTSRGYSTTFAVQQSPEEVYAAILAVSTWWTGEIEGTADEVGSEFSYRHGSEHYSRQRVVDARAGDACRLAGRRQPSLVHLGAERVDRERDHLRHRARAGRNGADVHPRRADAGRRVLRCMLGRLAALRQREPAQPDHRRSRPARPVLNDVSRRRTRRGACRSGSSSWRRGRRACPRRRPCRRRDRRRGRCR